VYKSELVIVEKSLYTGIGKSMSFAYLSDTRHLTERKRNVIKTIKHTHSGIHTYPVLSSIVQKTFQGGTEKFI
jgi:hypothetical protein